MLVMIPFAQHLVDTFVRNQNAKYNANQILHIVTHPTVGLDALPISLNQMRARHVKRYVIRLSVCR
jgi:hypothetical protein